MRINFTRFVYIKKIIRVRIKKDISMPVPHCELGIFINTVAAEVVLKHLLRFFMPIGWV